MPVALTEFVGVQLAAGRAWVSSPKFGQVWLRFTDLDRERKRRAHLLHELKGPLPRGA